MFGHFDEATLPPELKFVFKEMKKLAIENEALRKRVTDLETNQESLRKAINKVARDNSPKYSSPFTSNQQQPCHEGPDSSKTMGWFTQLFTSKKWRKQ